MYVSYLTDHTYTQPERGWSGLTGGSASSLTVGESHLVVELAQELDEAVRVGLAVELAHGLDPDLAPRWQVEVGAGRARVRQEDPLKPLGEGHQALAEGGELISLRHRWRRVGPPAEALQLGLDRIERREESARGHARHGPDSIRSPAWWGAPERGAAVASAPG